jgi:LmbE family N-acetylglucosaminyl deacetylase
MLNAQKILVLAPHTDDGELGAGGSMARWQQEGKEIYYAAFCTCAESLPAGWPADTLEKECRNATALLGLAADHVFIFDFRVRRLPEQRQEVLDKMRELQQVVQPGLVLIPAAGDIHQDHQVIHQEALRAFRHTSLAGYELPWNNFQFRNEGFVKLREQDLAQKCRALEAYASQAHRDYMRPDFIRSLATVRGLQCGHPLAESFEIYRSVY